MIDTKALRQKILDLAIRGKLVPQDPDDEPASVLLERIRQQKQQMVKAGKLKPKDIKDDSVIFVGEDNLHYEKFADGSVKCIEDEIPFDLPEGWAWVRLVSLIEAFITGPFGSALHKSDYVADGIPLINPMNITNGKVIPIDKMQVSPETAERLSSFKVAPSDIVIARRGDMGRCAVVQPAQKGWLCGTGSFILRFPAVLCSEYFAVCLRSPYSVELMSGNSIGNTMLNLNQTILKSILIPVPPCTEQNRIINAIFDADALLAEIANQSESLVMCVAKAKSKILDLAIRGQLVPQDPNDEPAIELLKRINPDFTPCDNGHYTQLPEGWAICKMKQITSITNGKSQKNVETLNGIYPIYGSGGVIGRANQYLCIAGSTIIGRKGTINNPIFVEEHFWNVDTAFGLKANDAILDKYLYYFCLSFDFSKLDKSTAMPSLTKTSIGNVLIPIPPYKEQERIVAKIDMVLDTMNEILRAV